METNKLNLESLDSIKKKCLEKNNILKCNNFDFDFKSGSDTLTKIFNYTDINIKNSNDADKMFNKLDFINLIIDEDQINTKLGGDGETILRAFNNYLLPTYLPLLTILNVDNSKIIDFYKNTEICWDSIDEEIFNHFDIKRFFTNLKTDFFNNPPFNPSFYDKFSQPEEYIYSIYFYKLEKTNEILLNSSCRGHATSIIIKKINNTKYEVNIIDTGNGEYSENYPAQNDNNKGHFGIKCRGIMTFEITDNINAKITAQKRILKCIYFFSNYYHFMTPTDENKRDSMYINFNTETFYQKIIPLLLINDNAQLILPDGSLVPSDEIDEIIDNPNVVPNNFRLIAYAKYTDNDAPWQILNIQTPGNCQFRAILYPLLWKIYDLGNINDINDITKFDLFNQWYNKVKFYEIVRAFYIIYKHNLITLKYQNIFNELLISYEKLLKKKEINADTDILKNIPIITKLKKIINIKFVRFLSGISYNSKESNENKDGVLNINIFQTDAPEYTETNETDNIFIVPIDLTNITTPIEKLIAVANYCKEITNILKANKIADEDLHKLGNYYILNIEQYIDILHSFFLTYIVNPEDYINLPPHLGTIIEKYIDIRTRVPVFSHQFDQSPLYCMGILQILGKIINEQNTLVPTLPELHKSLLLERIASAVPLVKQQKDFYDRLCKNLTLSYDFLMLNDNDPDDNKHLYDDEKSKLNFMEILFSKCFVFNESEYIKNEYKKFEKTVLQPNNTVLEDTDKNFSFKRTLYNKNSYSIRIIKLYNEMTSEKDKYIKRVKECMNKNNDYKNFKYLSNIIKVIHICNLPSIAPIGFTKYNINKKYSYLNNDYEEEFIDQGDYVVDEDYQVRWKPDIILSSENILIFTDYSMLYFSYLHSYFICNLESKFTIFNPKYKNNITNVINDTNKFTIASGGKVLNEINMLIQNSEFDKNYNINYKKLCENCKSYGPLIYDKLYKVNPFIPDNINVSINDYTKIKNTISNNSAQINKERLFMLNYIYNMNYTNLPLSDKLSEIKNCIIYNKIYDIFEKNTVNFELNINFNNNVNKLNTPLQNCMKLINPDETKMYLTDTANVDKFDEIEYPDSITKTIYGYFFDEWAPWLTHSFLISANLFFERLKWYETYDILSYSKYITDEFYKESTLYTRLTNEITIKLNPTNPIYSKLLKIQDISIKKYKVQNMKIALNTTSNKLPKDFCKEFINEEYEMLNIKNVEDFQQSILLNNKLFELPKFIIKIKENKILMYDQNNKIFLEQNRQTDLITYKIYKFNFQYNLFELIYEYTNNLKSLFHNSYLTVGDTIYESSELLEAPFYLNDYYYWKIINGDCSGHLIDDTNIPYYIKNNDINNDINYYIIKKKDNIIFLQIDNKIKMLDIFYVFKYCKGFLINFLITLSNCVDLSKIIIIQTSDIKYNIFIDKQTLNKIQIKFIVDINDNKVYLQDTKMEVILSNTEADIKISRFFRFVAGLSNTFLIREKSNTEENFKILSFPNVKIKRNEKDYVCNTIDVIPIVGYLWKPTILNNNFIKFKYNNTELTVDLNLFDLHYSGLFITNFNKENLNNALLLITNYLYQDKIDIARQFITQIYNLIYTFPFIEKMNILFNTKNLETLLVTHWNYSYVLLDKLKILSLWCNKYDTDFDIIDKDIIKIKDILSKGKIPSELLNQDNINRYVTKKFIVIDPNFNLPKFLFLYKNSINIPFNIDYVIKELENKTILNKLKGLDINILTKFNQVSFTNYNSSIYFMWDALFLLTENPPILKNVINIKEYTTTNIKKFLYYTQIKQTTLNPILRNNNTINFNSKIEKSKKSDLETNSTEEIDINTLYNNLIKKFICDINYKELFTNIDSPSANLKKILINKIPNNNNDIEFNDFKTAKDTIKTKILDKDLQYNKSFYINEETINNIEKYLNKLIYKSCYNNYDDCYYKDDEYNGNISNSIYNHICKLSKLGIKFIITSLFLTKIKWLVSEEKYDKINSIKYINTYNTIKLLSRDSVPKITLLYEFMMGYFTRDIQIEYINKILKNYKSSKSRIYQISMGAGKTSTLGPLISILYTQTTGKNIINIMPEHLIKDATKYYLNNLTPFFPLKLRVLENYTKNNNPLDIDMPNGKTIYLMSDKIAKVIYLNSKTNQIFNENIYYINRNKNLIEPTNDYDTRIAGLIHTIRDKLIDDSKLKKILVNSVSLIDEIDSLSDSRKSELNYPQTNSLPNNLKFRIALITCLVDHILDIKTSESPNSFRIIGGNLLVYNYDKSIKDKIIEGLNDKINKVFEKHSVQCCINISEVINKGEIIGNDINNINNLKLITDDQKYIIKHIFYDNLPTCLLQVYQLNYGLKDDSYITENNLTFNDPRFNLLAVPYTSAKKPASESKFTDIDLTLFYTYYSLRKLGQLRNHDISKIIDIYKNKHNVESYILNDINTMAKKEIEKYLNSSIDLELSKFNYMFESICEYKKLPNYINTKSWKDLCTKLLKDQDFINEYLYELIKDKSNIPADFNDNVSFIDIMSSSFTKTRIGFTGTPSELVPIDDGDNDFHFDSKSYIQENGSYNEYIKSMFRLHPLQFVENEIINIYIYNDDINIIEILTNILSQKKYDCLIDVAGLFKDFIPQDIASKIDNIINSNSTPKRKVVYMDIINNTNKYVLDTIINNYPKEDDKPGNFIYYDNSNIVGKDLKQADSALGLITIGPNTTFTDFSQGLYRFRKLKEGQKTDFIISYSTFKKIYEECTPTLPPIFKMEEKKYVIMNDKIQKMDNYYEILIGILYYMIKEDKILQNKNKFNFYIQNARVIYRNITDTKKLAIFEKSIGRKLYQVRACINNLDDLKKENITDITYKITISEYYKKIIEDINTKINNTKIKECITYMNNPISPLIGQSESLSLSQSMQLSLALSLAQSQYSDNNGSPNINFDKYYIALEDMTIVSINISTNTFYENCYRSEELQKNISCLNIIISASGKLYLTTGTTTLLINKPKDIVLSNGKTTEDKPFTILGSGYAKLKNGKKPVTFNEVYDLVKDYKYYNDYIQTYICENIFGVDNMISILPFQNIIANMYTTNTIEKKINLLSNGDEIIINNKFDSNKFEEYLNKLKDINTSTNNDELNKLLYYIIYKKIDSVTTKLKIDDIESLNIDKSIISNKKDIIYQIAGSTNIKLFYNKYLKYKNKYLQIKKINLQLN